MQPRDPNEKEVQFSHGWVTKFKKRFNIKTYTPHGEDASANTSAEVLRRMEDIKALYLNKIYDDVFNMDERGFSELVRAKSNVGYEETI